MPIYDVMLQEAPSDLKLLRVLCDCFEEAGDDATFLTNNVANPSEQRASLITVDRWPLTGDFALYASVATPIKRDPGDVAAFLAQALSTRALFSTEDASVPTGFVLVEPDGTRAAVSLAECDDAREIRLGTPDGAEAAAAE